MAGDRLAQRITGTALFADAVGFTPLAERLGRLGRRGAEELTTLIDRLVHLLIDVAIGHGGEVIAYGGDALFVVFAGESHEPLLSGPG